MRPVTGPDGENPITDEQIRGLRRVTRYARPRTVAVYREYTDAQVALGELSPGGSRDEYAARRSAARSRCADAWNACHATNKVRS